MNEVVEYWKAEVERLQSLLAAERIENTRLHACIAHLKEVAGMSIGTIQSAYEEARNESYIDSEALDTILTDLQKIRSNADDLMLPVAEKV